MCQRDQQTSRVGPAAGDAAAQIEQLLVGSISSPQEASRLCAAQWANRLFPFKHVPARYICVMAAGDAKLEVREEGQSGLALPKPPTGSATGMTPTTQLLGRCSNGMQSLEKLFVCSVQQQQPYLWVVAHLVSVVPCMQARICLHNVAI